MIKYALIGNQNSGKTTLFNALTGSHAQVGNWPGVTVEKREGVYSYKSSHINGEENVQATIVDLPGIYSLSPYSPEEIVSRNFLIDEHPDVCINIVDATNLERNLYLTTQVLEIDVPVVVAVNMIDAAYKKGIEVNTEKLQEILGVPVIAISALRGTNLDDLMILAYQASKKQRLGKSLIANDISIKELYEESELLLKKENHEIGSLAYHSVKLLEGDDEEVKNHYDIAMKIKEMREKIPLDVFDGDFQGKVADARFRFITSHINDFVTRRIDGKEVTTFEYERNLLKHKEYLNKLKKDKKSSISLLKSKIKETKKSESNAAVKADTIKYLKDKISKEKTQYNKKIIEEKKYISANMTTSEKIDNVLTSKIWGIPLFIVIMFLVFHLTFGDDFLYLGSIIKAISGSEMSYGEYISSLVGDAPWISIFFGTGLNCPGTMLQAIVETLTGNDYGIGLGLEYLFGYANIEWLTSLVLDGVWGGLSMVLSFIPQILVLFLFITILEDSGYMARAAFIMDRAFRKLGLSGKAFMPLIMCFGCAVPGIYATKALESERERKVTILLTPFFSCGAKLEIWLAFAAVLFAGAYGSLIIFGIYMLGVVVAFLIAFILRLTRFKPKASPFLMELPDYHLPRAMSVGVHLWEKLKHYLYKAGTIITTSIIVIWILQHLTFDMYYVPDGGTTRQVNGVVQYLTIQDSILGILSNYLRYIFWPTGFGDYVVTISNGSAIHLGAATASEIEAGAESVQLGGFLIVACFSGLIAKENVPGTLASVSSAAGFSSEEGIIEALALNPAVSFSFMAFNLLTIPCFAAIGAAKSELANTKDFIFGLLLWLLVGFGVAVFINVWQFGLIMLSLFIVIIGGKFILNYVKNKKANNTYAS